MLHTHGIQYQWFGTFQIWGVVTVRGTRLRELEKCDDDFGWLCGCHVFLCGKIVRGPSVISFTLRKQHSNHIQDFCGDGLVCFLLSFLVGLLAWHYKIDETSSSSVCYRDILTASRLLRQRSIRPPYIRLNNPLSF